MARELTKIGPFRMIDNIYFVGTKEASSHLIDTGEGLILIDTGYEETADIVLESMGELGFDPRDIKIILHSHGHYDHTDGTPKILKYAPEAKTYLSFKDIKYLNGFTPDYDIKEGDVIRLGRTEILCLFTPGHTEGSVSFFFNVNDGGETYRAAMFGGAGVNQLRKAYMHKNEVPYLCRGLFFDSIERLVDEPVDVMIGNHSWQNKTIQKYEKMATAEKNPFIYPAEWAKYLWSLHASLKRVMGEESRKLFLNYAHRGASAYYPENTMSAFEAGLKMGANGIETDVRKTKDGVLVLFHDSTLERVTGEAGSVSDYTYEQLCDFTVKCGDRSDKIPTLDEFLARFKDEEVILAIELKEDGIEAEVAALISKHDARKKCIVTAFELERIKKIKAIDHDIRIGYLSHSMDEELIAKLTKLEIDQICPKASEITPERLAAFHRAGIDVRAFGVRDEEIMRSVYDMGADGMTVNFPDKLAEYIVEMNPAEEQE